MKIRRRSLIVRHWRRAELRQRIPPFIGLAQYAAIAPYLIALLLVGGFPKKLFPVAELRLHRADPIEKGGKKRDAVRLRSELKTRIVE
jgi:hypothetical protein